jgi:AraC-like DNA-binding protein
MINTDVFIYSFTDVTNYMKLFIKYDMPAACKKILQEQLDKLELDYSLPGFNEVDINDTISGEKMLQINEILNQYGIQIIDSPKNVLIQKIKDAITELVYMEDKLPLVKVSALLSEKVGHSYGYISSLFSEVTYTSIENYIILQKTERAKQLMSTNESTITEIAWKLNYSSVAHFCNQFKSVTGLTPSSFQRIINKRRNTAQEVSKQNT